MNRFIAGLFLTALMAGACQVLVLEPPWGNIFSDVQVYMGRAVLLAAGEPLPSNAAFFPMGISWFYAVFLWLADAPVAYYLLAAFQVFALSWCHVLVYLTSRLLFGWEGAARLAAIMSLAYWPLTGQLSFFMSEPTFMAAMLTGQYLMIRCMLNPSWPAALAAGLLLGFAATIKTQGVVIVIAGALLLLFFPVRRCFAGVVGVLVLILLAQGLMLGRTTGEGGWITPPNGAFNMYMGQSAVTGVGTTDPETGGFTLFFNNNVYFAKQLLPIRMFHTSANDSAFFQTELNQLIRENPIRQLLRTLQSGFELHALQPHWPLRNHASWAHVETGFKFLLVPLAYLPALVALMFAIRTRRFLCETSILLLPLMGITAIAGLSMGQPRYLLPFLPNLFMLGSFGLMLIVRMIKPSEPLPDTDQLV